MFLNDIYWCLFLHDNIKGRDKKLDRFIHETIGYETNRSYKRDPIHDQYPKTISGRSNKEPPRYRYNPTRGAKRDQYAGECSRLET